MVGVVTRQIQFKLVVEYKPDQFSKISIEAKDPNFAQKEQLVSNPKGEKPNNLTRHASKSSLKSFDSGYI